MKALVNAWLVMCFTGTCCWCNSFTMGGCGMKKREVGGPHII